MAQLLNRRNTLLAAAASRVIGATVVISTGASTTLTIQKDATTTLPGTLILTALTARFVAPSYVWYTKLAGSGSYTLISGATTDTLTVTGDSQFITNVAGSTAIQYKVVVTETGGYTNTASYEVTIPILREGTNAITGALTNDTLTVPAATDGTVSAGVYSSLTSDFQIYNGSADDSANWTVSFTNSVGISATLSNGKTISITNITTAFESGYIELTATRQGYTSIVKRISVAKVKSGTIGVSPTIYDIVVPSPVIAKDAYGAYISSTLSISSFSTTESTTSAFSGIYKIYHNGSGTASYTSAAAESTKSYTLVAGLTSVKIELYNAAGTTLLDTQTIPVVESGSNAMYISIENGTYAIPSDASGNVSTYASSGAKITVREGTTALTYRTALGSNTSSFTIGTPTLSTANGIIVGSFSGNGTTTATVSAHSAMQSALQAIIITYPITYIRANGGQATEYITQSITKAYGGIRGSLDIYSTDATYTSTYDYDGAGAIAAGAASYVAKATDLVYSATTSSSPRTPIEGDTVTFTNGSTYVYTITYKASSSTWVAPGTVIDGNLLVTGSVTANKVDTRGLTIKDASGNTILQAGSSIDWSKLGGASSNLSGLGYTGDLNATRNVFRGDWAAGVNYVVGDAVVYGGYGWSCLTAHLSAAGTTPPTYPVTSNANWTISTVKGADGASGAAAITSVLSNEAHVLPASSDGTVSSYTGSGTEVRVFEGATELAYDGVGTSNGTWKVTTTPTNITVGTLTDSGTYLMVGAHSGVAAGTDTASIVYTITGKTASGSSFTITKSQSFSKSKAGATGATGPTGAAGAAGPAVTITPSRSAVFTATDGTLDASQTDIVFTAAVYGITSPTYVWTFSGFQTAPTSSGTATQTITAAQFGTSKSATVTCTVSGTYKDVVTVVRLEKSTAAAGATVGAPAGTSVGGTLAETVASKAAGALQKAGDQITGRVTMNVADAIFAGTDTNNGVYLGSTGLVAKKAGVTTFAIDTAGNAQFAGALAAATGSFAGSLSAATGTFAGSLTASAVNAVNTINLAGNSVTVPVSTQWTGSVALPVGSSNVHRYITQTPSTDFAGQPVLLTVQILTRGTAQENGWVNPPTLIIYRDTTVLTSVVGWSGGWSPDNTTISAGAILMLIDTPSAGSHVYKVYAVTESYMPHTVYKAVISAVGVKR